MYGNKTGDSVFVRFTETYCVKHLTWHVQYALIRAADGDDEIRETTNNRIHLRNVGIIDWR